MKKSLLILVALSGIMFQSCKKENVNPAQPTDSSKGAMVVKMTDAPADYAALEVKLVKVEAYLQNEGWINLSNESQIISVLDLTNGISTNIASSSSLEAGLYTKLRLTFGNENKLWVGAGLGGTQFLLDFTTSSEQQIEVQIDEQVNANASTEVLLDFNAAQSIIELGNTYILQPTIYEIEDTSTGVYGQVQGSIQASVTLSDASNSFSTYIAANGAFKLQGMADGTYDIVIRGIREGESQVRETTIENVVIVRGQFTNAGSVQL